MRNANMIAVIAVLALCFPSLACGGDPSSQPEQPPPDGGTGQPDTPGQAVLSLALVNTSDTERQCTLYIERDGVKTVLYPLAPLAPKARREFQAVASGPDSGYSITITGGCIGGPRPPEGEQLSTQQFWVTSTMSCNVNYYEPVAVLMLCQPG